MHYNVAKNCLEHSYVKVTIPEGGRGVRLKLNFLLLTGLQPIFFSLGGSGGGTQHFSHAFLFSIVQGRLKENVAGPKKKGGFGVKNYKTFRWIWEYSTLIKSS